RVWEKGQPIFSEDGRLEALEGFIYDVHERKVFEEALRASENLFQTLTRNAPVGIFRTDALGRTTYVNPQWCLLSGISSIDAHDMKWVSSLHPDDRDKVQSEWNQAVLNKQPSKATYRFIQPTGRVVWVSGQAVPEFNSTGELIGYIGTVADISPQIHALESLKVSEEELQKTNKLLRIIIDDLPDAIYMKDEYAKKVIANKADCENCGCETEDELIGKDDFDLFPKDIAERFWADDQRVLKEGVPVINRIERLVNNNGKVKWLQSSKVPFRDASGKIIGLVGVGRDITREKEAETESLKLSKAISQSPVSIVVTDTKGIIEYVNPKFSEVTGYSFDEVKGENPRILKSGQQGKEFYQYMWQDLLAGKDWKGEFLNRKKNGELYWENAIISPILNDEGGISHFVAVKEDITEKKKILEELVRAKEKAEESDLLKSSFLANMSHEIRTPLNSILGFSNILTMDDDLSPHEKSEYSEIINKSADSLLQIINDIIDISSLETGQLQIYTVRMNLSSILKSLYTVFTRKKLEMGKNHIELKIIDEPGIQIVADENRLIQIFTNLLNNALKFTDAGEIVFGVEGVGDTHVTLYVSDTGIGIPKEMHQSVFERFRQGERSKTRAYGGNGLGLSIVKNLVELMGGAIWLESEPTRGSVFR
ncbi:MAG TPA: PAS domain S-box protein, partial [Prolixibacteraceae bacterium]|nr:PAS domain S-box protein [Prolixibacteraceae bacterium]